MKYRLDELSVIKRGGSPRPITDYLANEGLPWLKISDFNYGERYVYNSHEFIIPKGLNKTKLVKKNTLIVTNSATPGIPIFLGKDMCLHDGFLYFESISDKVLPMYLYYFLLKQRDFLKSQGNGSIFINLKKEILERTIIDLPDIENQNHIVNTIGSVDDLIENYNKKIEKLMNLGLTKINLLNNKKDKIDLSLIAKFEKGNEVGSSNYHDYYKNNFTNYIRVGDLISLSNTYVDKNICNKFAKEEDILIAMDGAPGRNTIGLKGSYSSGLYKIICNKDKKGLVYFELNSYLNQNIIKDMSQGTTILHASKSIPLLKTIELNECDNEYFNNIFNEIIILKKKVFLLKNIKEKLLIKYFTNQ